LDLARLKALTFDDELSPAAAGHNVEGVNAGVLTMLSSRYWRHAQKLE